MIVFAFDRDWTVDVNPHPRHEAVPLRWVRHLAHETDHPVYAIGNQDLAPEAAIPGVVDIVGRHPDDWDEWLGEKQPDGSYEQFPLRRERLALIQDLHPEAEAYVVVDDLDLSDVEGWDHYHAWEFVPAVRDGAVHPELPWVDEPITDGGRPMEAETTSTDSTDLMRFLADVPDDRVCELTYTDDGREETRLLWSASAVNLGSREATGSASIQCVPLAPGAESFSVAVDDVQSISVVDPSSDLFTTEADDPAEEATAMRRLAETDPQQVRVSSVLALLDDGQTPREDALRALAAVVEARPEDCTLSLPTLGSLLEDADPSSAEQILLVLTRIAEERPNSVAPSLDRVIPWLSSQSQIARARAARCVGLVANDHPAEVVDAVPELATIAEAGGLGQPHAVYALSSITHEFPEDVEPAADALSASIADDSLDDGVRLNATAALGRIVQEYPEVGLGVVDDAVALLDEESAKLRNNAVGLVGDVAQLHSDIVEPHVDAVADLLTSEDEPARINASACLARVAEDFPESVGPYVDTFVELLTADHPVVRKNACWALGHVGADEAEMDLVERASRDEDQAVRERAEWALRQVRE